MSVIVVSKKAHNALRYFTLMFALMAFISLGANVKMLFDVKSYETAYTQTAEQLSTTTEQLETLNSQLHNVTTEKKKLEQKLEKKKIALLAESNETECMAKAVYYEAGGESLTGKKAVANVIWNRMKDGDFPRSACGVVYQGVNDNKTGCQFSWACDGVKRAVALGSAAWQESKQVAVAILSGKRENVVDDALYFHSGRARPSWATNNRFVTQIGNHRFYR